MLRQDERDNMVAKFKALLKMILPLRFVSILMTIRNLRDLVVSMNFVLNTCLNVSIRHRIRIVKQLYVISFSFHNPHSQEDILSFIETILLLPSDINGVIVEAGCYKGGSTAKFSLAADIAGRELVAFDSFQGLPNHTEPHDKSIFGENVGTSFEEGAYSGSLDEVKANVSKYGKISCCRFIKGWFEDTLPRFQEPICAVYLDVDLASSTRTCAKYLYPLLESGGVLFSQDGHLPLVIDVFDDDGFWMNEVGCKKPRIYGLRQKQLIKIIK